MKVLGLEFLATPNNEALSWSFLLPLATIEEGEGEEKETESTLLCFLSLS